MIGQEKSKVYTTKNAKETQKLGENLAEKILKQKKSKNAFIIALEGELGSGKTTFLQGFAKGLGIKEKILSPTFIIMKKFQVSSFRFQEFYHIDCYRINSPKEILELGFKDIISNSRNIVAIEWAEKIKKIIPKNATKIKFKFINEKTRKLTF